MEWAGGKQELRALTAATVLTAVTGWVTVLTVVMAATGQVTVVNGCNGVGNGF